MLAALPCFDKSARSAILLLMTKTMFAGDVHGNDAHLKRLFARAVELDVKTIVQCGDIGWWPAADWGRKLINTLGELVDTTLIPFYFIPGNHEDWNALHAYEKQYGTSQPFRIPTSSGQHDGLWYVPKGATLKLGDTTLMGFGGGFSVDWMYRTVGKSWWPDELITQADVDALPENLKIDILVSHEVPKSVSMYSWKNDLGDEHDQRKLVLEAVRKVKPDRVICAHHHTRFSGFTSEGVPVEVLDCDQNDFGSSYLILDL
jgi:DNA repair exonuclease SbcCD nuclease subunit